MKLTDLRAVVTGAGSGLGRSAVDFMLGHGAKVGALDVDDRLMEGAYEEFSRTYPKARLFAHVADVSKEEQVVSVLQKLNKEMGGINALFNIAGIYRDGLLVRDDGGKFPLAQWQRVIDVDLTGSFLMAREAAAIMVSSRVVSGVIINISSISRHGNVGQSPYSAAKAGIVADTRLWARELAPYQIRVAAISPGLIDTPSLRAMEPATLRGYLNRIPLKRLGKPEEVNLAIRFVVECDYFTGECLELNGGFQF